MIRKRLPLVILIFSTLSFSASSADTKALKFECIIKESDYDSNYIFNVAGAEMAVDDEGYIYLLDRLDGIIRKYDTEGKLILKFGRNGIGPGEIASLSEITFAGNGKLVTYNMAYKIVNEFSKNGRFIKSNRKEGKTFSPIFLKDNAVLYYESKWIENGKNYNSFFSYRLILEDKKGLHTLKTYTDEKYRKPLVKINTKLFQDNRTYCERFLYTADSQNTIYYALSDDYKIWRYKTGKNELLIDERLTPLPFDDKKMLDDIKKEEQMRQKHLGAKYIIAVPKFHQIIYKITVDEKDNIWVYVKSREYEGLLKYSPDGRFLNYYPIGLSVKEILSPVSGIPIFISKNNIYIYKYNTETGVEVYLAKIKE